MQVRYSDQEIVLSICLVFDDKAKVQWGEHHYSHVGWKVGKIFLKVGRVFNSQWIIDNVQLYEVNV